jgi:hypothetical protein
METQHKQSPHKCPHCGANMKIWKHRLSKGLVMTLRKTGLAIKTKGKNDIDLQKEMDLTKNQYNNFQKLRYFGLVHHVKDQNGNRKAGRWLITRNGWAFLRGELPVCEYVRTFRNKIYDKAENNKFVFEFDPSYSRNYFQSEFDFDIFQEPLI